MSKGIFVLVQQGSANFTLFAFSANFFGGKSYFFVVSGHSLIVAGDDLRY